MIHSILLLILFSSQALISGNSILTNKATMWDPPQVYCFDCECVNYYGAHEYCEFQAAQTQLGCISLAGGACPGACSLVAYPRPAGTQCPYQGFIQ